MRFFTTFILATLTATAAALVSSPAGVIEARANGGRANGLAEKGKHDANHEKLANGTCGKGCKDSLASYHSQASKDSQASRNSKNSQASKNSKNSKNSKGSKGGKKGP